MRIQDNSEAPQDNDPHDIPENVRKILQSQGRLVNDAKPAQPKEQVNLAPVDMPLPPNFGKVREEAPEPLTQKRQIEEPSAPEQVLTKPADKPKKEEAYAVKSRPTRPEHLDNSWQRVDFPSNLVPYKHLGIDEIYLKPFTTAVLEAIYSSIETSNHSAYLDALDSCISCDLRSLTVPDYIYMQYWLRMASYTRSPYTVSWTSRYGNEYRTQVKMTDLEVIYLQMTVEEYEGWLAKGIAFPTVREAEFMLASNEENAAAEGNAWSRQNAQYIVLPDGWQSTYDTDDPMIAKIRHLRKQAPDFLHDIIKFAEISGHGVTESVKMRDTEQFEPEKAIAYLRQAAEGLRNLARTVMDDSNQQTLENTAGLVRMAEIADEFSKEADDIAAAVEAGNKYEVKEEVVELRSIQPTDMFPSSYPV